MSLLMGIDLGTSSLKTMIIDASGKILSFAQEEYPIEIPSEGFAEQNPEKWWRAAVLAIQKAIQPLGTRASEIKCIGLSGQMHGLVLLDNNCQPIRPAIIHTDQRSTEQINNIFEKKNKADFSKITLNTLYPGFLFPSLLWVKQKEPANYKKIYKILLPKDYIRFRLTSELGTEPSDASGSLAFNTTKGEWAKELLNLFDFDIDHFPPVNESLEIAGSLTQKASEQTGLQAGIPVVFGGSDQPMQAFGNGAIAPGVVTSTIGTSGQVFTPVEKPFHDEQLRVHTFSNLRTNMWYVMGGVMSAGLALRWFQRNVVSRQDLEVMNQEASRISPGSDGLIFLPYLIGSRTPHMDPKARGMFLGLNIEHNSAHLTRAVMEGVGFALRDSFEILKEIGIEIDTVIASGGGAKSELWLQIQADIYGREIYVSEMEEQACIGAAMAAGIGCGIYDGMQDACDSVVRIRESPVEPVQSSIDVYNRQYEIYKKLYATNRAFFY